MLITIQNGIKTDDGVSPPWTWPTYRMRTRSDTFPICVNIFSYRKTLFGNFSSFWKKFNSLFSNHRYLNVLFYSLIFEATKECQCLTFCEEIVYNNFPTDTAKPFAKIAPSWYFQGGAKNELHCRLITENCCELWQYSM